MDTDHKKYLEPMTGLNGPCQKNQEIANTEHKPVIVDNRTIYIHCNLKGHPIKMGLTNSPICERCLKINESVTHTPHAHEAGDY
jgi:hypothetical protein